MTDTVVLGLNTRPSYLDQGRSDRLGLEQRDVRALDIFVAGHRHRPEHDVGSGRRRGGHFTRGDVSQPVHAQLSQRAAPPPDGFENVGMSTGTPCGATAKALNEKGPGLPRALS